MSKNNHISRIFAMRHGERLDFTFGNWLSYSLNKAGEYVPQDLNMPVDLPTRSDTQAWAKDSPLTRVGVYQANLIGGALRRSGVVIDKAYSSPSFRSVTTCAAVLEGLHQRDQVQINVDPSLFEWCMSHKCAGETAFDWLTLDELTAGGFNVNKDYQSRIATKEIETHLDETVEEFHQRNGLTLDTIAATGEGQNILVVGHAATVEVVYQRLLGLPVRGSLKFTRLLNKIPYCSCICLERDMAKGPKWRLVQEEGKFSLTQLANLPFDSAVLVNE